MIYLSAAMLVLWISFGMWQHRCSTIHIRMSHGLSSNRSAIAMAMWQCIIFLHLCHFVQRTIILQIVKYMELQSPLSCVGKHSKHIPVLVKRCTGIPVAAACFEYIALIILALKIIISGWTILAWQLHST